MFIIRQEPNVYVCYVWFKPWKDYTTGEGCVIGQGTISFSTCPPLHRVNYSRWFVFSFEIEKSSCTRTSSHFFIVNMRVASTLLCCDCCQGHLDGIARNDAEVRLDLVTYCHFRCLTRKLVCLKELVSSTKETNRLDVKISRCWGKITVFWEVIFCN
jgi:hypothetical protein